jgi:xanthosine utilization system XapX-like protein
MVILPSFPFARGQEGIFLPQLLERPTEIQLTECHPELVSGSIPAHDPWILKQVQDDDAEYDSALVEPVADSNYETEAQENFQRWLGSLALEKNVGVQQDFEQSHDTNLLEQMKLAKNGSPEAGRFVDITIGTAVAEACFKSDHITKITTELNPNGQLMQFGQTMQNVHKNALTMRPNRHEKLQEITKIEALNGQRIEAALQAGELDDYYFVVPSIVPDDVPETQLGPEGDGYFVHSLTFVIQATTKETSGAVTTESAFLAGTDADEQDDFESRIAKRHDISSLQKIYENFGLVAPDTAAGFLANGLQIHKSLLPNGVADVARWLDTARGEISGAATTKTDEYYQNLRENSRQKEARLADVKAAVREEFLHHAEKLDEPMEAVKLLWQIIKTHAVEASFQNTDIDPYVFGREAVENIREARTFLARGDYEAFLAAREKSHETATVSGCGGGAAKKDQDKENGAEKQELGDKFGSLQFSCPKCHRTNTRPQGKLLSRCQHCGKDVTCATK